MPRKIRQVEQALRRAGFVVDPARGKGSHRWWKHPDYGLVVELSGNAGSDVQRYQDKQANEAIAEARRLDEEDA